MAAPDIGNVNQASIQEYIKESINNEQIQLFGLPDGIYGKKIPKVKVPEMEGKRYRVDFHLGTNFGGGAARGPLQELGEGTGNVYGKGYLTDKVWYYHINIDGQWYSTLRNAKDKGLYMDDLSNLIEGTMTGYNAMMERFHWGLGDGTIATVSVISTVFVTVSANIRHFNPGMFLEFWGGTSNLTHRIGGSNDSLPARFQVVTVDWETNIIELDTAPTSLTVGDLITAYGNTYVTGGVKYSNEPYGVPYYLRNNVTIMDVDLTLPVNTLLKPYITTATYTSSMEPLGWKVLLDNYYKSQSRARGKIKEIWCGDTTITKFLEWQDTKTVDLGFRILAKEDVGTGGNYNILHGVEKIPLYQSQLMPLNEWWIMPKADANGEPIGMCYPWEIQWCNEGEGPNHLHNHGAKYDAKWGWFNTKGQMVAKKFYRLGKVTWS